MTQRAHCTSHANSQAAKRNIRPLRGRKHSLAPCRRQKTGLYHFTRGVATSGKETMLEQNRHLMEVLNMGEVETSQSMPLIEAVFDEIESQVRHNDESEIDVVAMADSLGLEVPEIVMSSLVRYLSQRNVTFDQLVVLDVRSRVGRSQMPRACLERHSRQTSKCRIQS